MPKVGLSQSGGTDSWNPPSSSGASATSVPEKGHLSLSGASAPRHLAEDGLRYRQGKLGGFLRKSAASLGSQCVLYRVA